MKFLKIGEDFFAAAAIEKISQAQIKIKGVEQSVATLHFASGKQITISRADLERIFQFTGFEEIEIEQSPGADWEIN